MRIEFAEIVFLDAIFVFFAPAVAAEMIQIAGRILRFATRTAASCPTSASQTNAYASAIRAFYAVLRKL